MKIPLLLLSVSVVVFSAIARGDSYDDLRTRWQETLVGPSSFTPDAAITAQLNAIDAVVVSNGTSRDTVNGTGYWDTMNTAGGRTYLWSDLASTTCRPTSRPAIHDSGR